jgi:hypothetical protein
VVTAIFNTTNEITPEFIDALNANFQAINDALDALLNSTRAVIGATGPRVPEMAIAPTGGRTQFISRHSMVIGRRLRWIQIGFKNSYLSGTGLRVAAPTSLAIVGAKIKGTRWSEPVSWLDTVPTPTPTIIAGGELLTARLYPADLGLPSFEAGQTIWWDMCGQLPSGSGRHLVGPVYTYNNGVGATGFFAIYPPADHIDQLGTNGDMATPSNAMLGNEFGAAGWDGDPPGPSVPANNMCVGASYLVGGEF